MDAVIGQFTDYGDGMPATLSARVTYVQPGGEFGLEEGFVAMGLADIEIV